MVVACMVMQQLVHSSMSLSPSSNRDWNVRDFVMIMNHLLHSGTCYRHSSSYRAVLDLLVLWFDYSVMASRHHCSHNSNCNWLMWFSMSMYSACNVSSDWNVLLCPNYCQMVDWMDDLMQLHRMLMRRLLSSYLTMSLWESSSEQMAHSRRHSFDSVPNQPCVCHCCNCKRTPFHHFRIGILGWHCLKHWTLYGDVLMRIYPFAVYALPTHAHGHDCCNSLSANVHGDHNKWYRHQCIPETICSHVRMPNSLPVGRGSSWNLQKMEIVIVEM